MSTRLWPSSATQRLPALSKARLRGWTKLLGAGGESMTAAFPSVSTVVVDVPDAAVAMTACVEDVTLTIVSPVGIPDPLMGAPTSPAVNPASGAETAVLPALVEASAAVT